MRIYKAVFAALALFSCMAPPPAIKAEKTGAFKPPSGCKDGPTERELERQKEDLFSRIKSSENYTSAEARKEALKKYRTLIEGAERSSCPADVELFISAVIKLHKS